MRQAGLKISAVVIGLAVDIGASTALAFGFGMLIGLRAARSGGGEAAIAAAFTSPGVLALGLAIGTACSALGGYVAARLAPHAPRFHGMAVGIASVATGIFAMTHGVSDGPAWATVLSGALTIPAALVGSMLVASADDATASRLAGASQ